MAKHHFWKAGFAARGKLWWSLVVAPLAILTALVMLREALSPDDRAYFHLDYLPSVRTHKAAYLAIILGYVIIVLLYLVPAAIKAMLEKGRERSDEKIRRYQRVRQSERRPESSRIDFAESNIEPYPMEIISAHRNERGFIVEASTDKAMVRALVIPFKNKRHHRSLRRVGDAYDVSAEVSWVSWDGETFDLKPGPAAWLSEEREKIPFRRDDQPSRLILATTSVSDYSNLCATQRQTATLSSAVREIPLTGTYWRVGVVFHSESEAKPIARYNFILERDGHVFWDYVETGTPYLITYNLWKDARLTKSILEGYDLWKRVREGEDVSEDHAMWQANTATFLARNFDAKPRSKFLFEKHGAGKFVRQPVQPTGLEERIGKQIDTLNELSKKD